MIILGVVYNATTCAECRQEIKFKEQIIAKVSYFPTEDEYYHLKCNPFPDIIPVETNLFSGLAEKLNDNNS